MHARFCSRAITAPSHENRRPAWFPCGRQEKTTQLRWSFSLALSEKPYGQQTAVVKASYFLFLIYTPNWKHYSQLKTHNFLRFKPQENKWSAVSSSHIISSKWIPFLHGCYYSVVTKCTSHSALENAYWFAHSASPFTYSNRIFVRQSGSNLSGTWQQ